MSTNYILALNIGMSAAIAFGFLAVFLYSRTLRSAFWWVLSFGLAVVAASVEAIGDYFIALPLVNLSTNSLTVLSISCLNVGLALHYRQRVPWKIIDGLLVVTLVLGLVMFTLPHGNALYVLVAQAPFAAIQIVGATLVVKSKRKRSIDRALTLALMLGAVNYLLRPVLMFSLNDSALAATYDVFVLTMSVIISLSIAFLLLMQIIGDLLLELKGRSETDSLSGLLNRHGLKTALDEMEKSGSGHGKGALIVCDLDLFKAVNDTYGHDAGDRVIKLFAKQLLAGARDGDFCTRLGGEEFCVYLRNSDIRAARLFAEWVRIAFSSSQINGLPSDVRVSASFGVSSVVAGEDFEEAYKRADEALYIAKSEGRNRVKIASAEGEKNDMEKFSFSAKVA